MISVPAGWGVPKKPAAAAGVVNPDAVDENGQPKAPTGGTAQPSTSADGGYDGSGIGAGQGTHATPALPAIADPTTTSTNTAGAGSGGGGVTSTTQVQPNSAVISPIPGGAGAVALPGETLAQTAARYKADYHSPDADVVNAALDKLLHPSTTPPPTAGTGAPNFATPEGQMAWLTPLIQQYFPGDDPIYWAKRIGETGGGWGDPANVQWWEQNIRSGPQGREPGGAYYDSGAAGGGAGQAGGYNDAIHSAILKLLDRGFSPVDSNDPQIAGPTTAFRNQAQYGADRNREALAERAAQEGMGSGAFDTAVQSGNEKAAMDTASYAGNLQVQELQARRNDIATALQFAQGEDAQALSLQLARMDDQIKRLSLSQNESQFVDTQNYNLGKDDATFDYLYSQLAGQ